MNEFVQSRGLISLAIDIHKGNNLKEIFVYIVCILTSGARYFSEVSIEVPATSRHRRDMSERVLKAT